MREASVFAGTPNKYVDVVHHLSYLRSAFIQLGSSHAETARITAAMMSNFMLSVFSSVEFCDFDQAVELTQNNIDH